MTKIKLLVTAGLFSFVFGARAAQGPTPSPAAPPELTPTPTPSASTSPPKPASPAITPKAESPKEVAAPETPAARALIDSLSEAEVQEAINLLKSNYINPAALSDVSIARATLQGLLDRLAPGASITSAPAAGGQEANPFRAEILDGRIGYARLGVLSKSAVAEMNAAFQDFAVKGLKSLIVDLRATPQSSDFDLAADVIKSLCPKGKMLFTVKKPNARQERIFTSNQDPKFRGLVIVLVDGETAAAAEIIAAALRIHAKALVVGENTKGQPVEYADLLLRNGKFLRVAVAEATLPDNTAISLKGVQPDIIVAVPEKTKRELMQIELEKGVAQFVFETERARMNEAALVSGANPEMDALQAAQRNKSPDHPKAPLRDAALQRAVDLVTTIGIFEAKPKTDEN